MRRSKLLGLAAAVALALTVTPAGPAAQASPPGANQPMGGCSYNVANTDPTNPQSTHYEGTLDAQVGWTGPNRTMPTTTSSSVTCTLQTQEDAGAGGTLATCNFTGPQPQVVTGSCVVSFNRVPTDRVYLCTSLAWTDSAGTHTRTLDHDARPGNQCSPTSQSKIAVPAHRAVVGYIAIRYATASGQTRPQVTLHGDLANPLWWACSPTGEQSGFSGSLTVTCNPEPGTVLDWKCHVLHADATSLNALGRARASLDCDGSAPPEAQTAVVQGTGTRDSVFAQSTMIVSRFSCTVDGGTLPNVARPDFVVGCGDPGLVTLD